jgi:serine/threonine protein kinase
LLGEEEYTAAVDMWSVGAVYRAPEVLLGEEEYTEAVDMWSVGAVFGELLKHEPLFPGKTEMDMLSLMATLLGAPSEAIWPVCPLPHGNVLFLEPHGCFNLRVIAV